MDNNKAGLYLHVPFCVSKCGYCSFYSITSSRFIPEFVSAIQTEMAFYQKTCRSFDTVYIGGGTPSLLSAGQIGEILNAVHCHFIIDRQAEITVEVNPGDVSLEYLQALHHLGVNRVNIGIQSFDNQLLKFLGRRHTAKEAVAAFVAARQAGFGNIGVDLIYGIHEQEIESWKQTLQKVLTFSPEHLSCYQLSLEKKTPLYKHYMEHKMQLLLEKEALDFFLTTSRVLTGAGYLHYEVSNFARSDSFKSRHNMKYWCHAPYLGVGPAAHSFLDGNRWWNKAAVKTYLKDISEEKRPVEESENLSMKQHALEALFLGMRTSDGINLNVYKTLYGSDLLAEKAQIIEELIKNDLVEVKDGFLCPTLAGMAVADSLALI